MVYVITLLAATQLPVAYACSPTPQVITPTPTPTTTRPPAPTPMPPGMFFFFLSNIRQPTVRPPLQLMAGITVNQENFINFQPTTVAIPIICNDKKQWQTGDPPLVISTIECVISNF
ncbi:unnamed protein product [Onchocerca ochengi]|uniref:Secreted protein n=1 Tax=Onchocerca ochengi TaxID=42157 RepID=A0A182DY90_ONCOC|nr:unnamed protein product [Onchocerca ochengi]VDK62543.1 unnamed protein product [Onchocerca ochengi]